MDDKKDKKQIAVKKPYQKPQLNEEKLVREEMLTGGCYSSVESCTLAAYGC